LTEEEARGWLRETLSVNDAQMARLGRFGAVVVEENSRQNLISSGSVSHLWARHIVDSAQLLSLAPEEGDWLDLGTGAGFPGIIVAILRDAPVHCVEARKGRIAFLERAASELGLTNLTVHGCRLEALQRPHAAVISARAFAPLPRLLGLAHRFSTENTLWLLPKGRSAQSELESVRGTWQGLFHVKQSVTDPESAILVAKGVRKRPAS
jgi:16S rRNA (guanine527-N7)-methyltransferase